MYARRWIPVICIAALTVSLVGVERAGWRGLPHSDQSQALTAADQVAAGRAARRSAADDARDLRRGGPLPAAIATQRECRHDLHWASAACADRVACPSLRATLVALHVLLAL